MSFVRASIVWRQGRALARGRVLQPWPHATVSTSAVRLSETEGESSTASESGQSSDVNSSQGSSDSQQQSAILQASLQFVPEHGWSSAALAQGARSLGLPGVAHGMFPHGGGELVDHFEAECNTNLVEFMQQQELKGSRLLHSSVEHRLRMLIPYLNKWPQAMALKGFPSNIPSSVETLALMVDDMWYWAGDRSTDFSWYTKRALLTSVYTATELHLVQDSSVDFQDTWDFLGRRMEDTATLVRARKQFDDSVTSAMELLSASFTTVRNMVGLNCQNR